MNNSIAVPDDRAWPLQQYMPPTEAVPGQRVYSAVNILDFPTFLRILQHWRWLILGAVAFGVLAAIVITPADDADVPCHGHAGGQSADGRDQRRAVSRA